MTTPHNAVPNPAADVVSWDEERQCWQRSAAEQVEIIRRTAVERDEARAEVERLRAALRRAHEQLSKYDRKGPKQIGRAMLTIERVMPELTLALDEDHDELVT
jgi:hypothetical protein